MDIYLSGDGGDFTFPALPEKIQKSLAMQFATYNTISGGEYQFANGRKDGPIRWSGTFYGQSRKGLEFLREWTSPKQCVKTLTKWMHDEEVLRLLVTDTPINEDVQISKFDWSPVGGYGDIEYTIVFQPYREMKVYTKKEAKITSYEKKTKPRNKTTKKDTTKKSESKSYTIKSGDTLWAIAKKYYGNGSKWQTIYKANKSALDKAAKKYGHSSSNGGNLIFPGTKLTIPAK